MLFTLELRHVNKKSPKNLLEDLMHWEKNKYLKNIVTLNKKCTIFPKILLSGLITLIIHNCKQQYSKEKIKLKEVSILMTEFIWGNISD